MKMILSEDLFENKYDDKYESLKEGKGSDIPDYKVLTSKSIIDTDWYDDFDDEEEAENARMDIIDEWDKFLNQRGFENFYDDEIVYKLHFFNSPFRNDKIAYGTIYESVDSLAAKEGVDLVEFDNGNLGFVASYSGELDGFEILGKPTEKEIHDYDYGEDDDEYEDDAEDFDESLNESNSNVDFVKVEPNYTGGGIYVFRGELSDGTWFIADNSYYDVRIVNADVFGPDESFEDCWYADWQEEHLVRDLDEKESKQFHKKMINWILENEPEGNYNSGDMEDILDDLASFNESLKEGFSENEVIEKAKENGYFDDMLEYLKSLLEYNDKKKRWEYPRMDSSGRDFYRYIYIWDITDDEKELLSTDIIYDNGNIEDYDWDTDVEEVQDTLYYDNLFLDSLFDALDSSLSESLTEASLNLNASGGITPNSEIQDQEDQLNAKIHGVKSTIEKLLKNKDTFGEAYNLAVNYRNVFTNLVDRIRSENNIKVNEALNSQDQYDLSSAIYNAVSDVIFSSGKLDIDEKDVKFAFDRFIKKFFLDESLNEDSNKLYHVTYVIGEDKKEMQDEISALSKEYKNSGVSFKPSKVDKNVWGVDFIGSFDNLSKVIDDFEPLGEFIDKEDIKPFN